MSLPSTISSSCFTDWATSATAPIRVTISLQRGQLPHPVLCVRREDPHEGGLLQVHDHGQPRSPAAARVQENRAPAVRHRPRRQLDQLEDEPGRRGQDRGPEAGHRVAHHQSFMVFFCFCA